MDNGNNNTDKARETILFQHLVVMLQTLAFSQMGKLSSPVTGKMERELHQAKITVDMLEMLQKKTEGNLDEDEKRFLDTVMMELQMNYVDETARAEQEEADAPAEEEKDEDIHEDPEAGGDGEEPEGKA